MVMLLLSLGCARAHAQEAHTDLRMGVERARAGGLIAESEGTKAVEPALLRLVNWRLQVASIKAQVALEEGAVRVTPAKEASAKERAIIRSLVRSLGRCEFFEVAVEDDIDGGLAAERERFLLWLEENPDRPWLDYNGDPAREARRLAWYPTKFGAEPGGKPMAVLLPTTVGDSFGCADLGRVYGAQDSFGHPAIGFVLLPDRAADFEAFTERLIGNRLAIVVEGKVRSAPTLNTKLASGGIIEGRFTDEERLRILAMLQE